MKTRILTGIVLIAGFLAALFFAPQLLWIGLIAAILGLGLIEWSRLARLNRAGTALFVIIGMLAAISAYAYPGFFSRSVLYGSAAVFWLLIAPLWLARRWTLPPALTALAGLIVLVPTALALIDLRQGTPGLLLALMAAVWIADSAAYFVGRKFGRRKLAPQISPGKTWEGALGALIVVAVYALIITWARDLTLTIALGLLMFVPLSIIGDLFESWMKRSAGVKDSGNLLPGHGGVLDRIDGLTATLPLAAGVFLLLHRAIA